jgi:hypothetical protein
VIEKIIAENISKNNNSRKYNAKKRCKPIKISEPNQLVWFGSFLKNIKN